MTFLVYVDAISGFGSQRRGPVGFITRSRRRDALRHARSVFRLKPSESPFLLSMSKASIRRAQRRQLTAVKRGRDASFEACWKAAGGVRWTKQRAAVNRLAYVSSDGELRLFG